MLASFLGSTMDRSLFQKRIKKICINSNVSRGHLLNRSAVKGGLQLGQKRVSLLRGGGNVYAMMFSKLLRRFCNDYTFLQPLQRFCNIVVANMQRILQLCDYSIIQCKAKI